MKKYFLSLVLIFLSCNLFAQDHSSWKAQIQDPTPKAKWAREIKRLISPQYVLLKDDYEEDYGGYENISYDINTQKLTTTDGVYDENEKAHEKVRTIFKKLPPNFSLRLTALKDVNDHWDHYKSILEE